MDTLTRTGYLAHAEDGAFRRAIEASQRIITAHPDYALSVSWGKDSVAMLALAVRCMSRPVVLNARYPNPAERFADMDRVRDAVLSRRDMSSVHYIEVDCPGEWEMYERAGRAFAEPDNAAERAAAKWWRTEFTTRMRAAMEAAGRMGVMLGLRQNESWSRRMNVATRGVEYEKRDGLRVALPVARLSGCDIWSILVAADMPWLRIYDMAPDRETARSGFVWSTGAIGAISRHGAVSLWRQCYPEEIAAWCARWPDLSRTVSAS